MKSDGTQPFNTEQSQMKTHLCKCFIALPRFVKECRKVSFLRAAAGMREGEGGG